MSMAQQVEQQSNSVHAAACAALSKAQGDQSKAIRFMADRVRKDAALRHAILDPLVEYACGNAIRGAIHDSRSKVWNAPAVRSDMSQADRVRVLAAGTLSMFQLPGGKKLGEASRVEVSEAADFYGKQAEDMSHKARWLRLIAQSVPDGKAVGDVLNDERLSALRSEALSHE